MQVPSYKNKNDDEQEFISLKTPRTHQSGIDFGDDENNDIIQMKIKDKKKRDKIKKNSIIEEISNEDL